MTNFREPDKRLKKNSSSYEASQLEETHQSLYLLHTEYKLGSIGASYLKLIGLQD